MLARRDELSDIDADIALCASEHSPRAGKFHLDPQAPLSGDAIQLKRKKCVPV
jgi:hypothetical protein